MEHTVYILSSGVVANRKGQPSHTVGVTGVEDQPVIIFVPKKDPEPKGFRHIYIHLYCFVMRWVRRREDYPRKSVGDVFPSRHGQG